MVVVPVLVTMVSKRLSGAVFSLKVVWQVIRKLKAGPRSAIGRAPDS